jgi:prolyl-tRNA editing enzyme YbaK/EbsC (Cys-tRNA(Pro) deacylase)
MNDADLEAFLTRHGVVGNIVRLPAHTPTVETAAQAMGTTVQRIAKSLLFLLEQGEAGAEPLLVIANGTARVDYRSVAGSVGLARKRVRLADAATVESVTGYPVGGVPPLGHPRPLRTLIDRRVLAESEVYAGGGALHALLRIAPAEIVRVTGAQTVDVVGAAAQGAGSDR